MKYKLSISKCKNSLASSSSVGIAATSARITAAIGEC